MRRKRVRLGILLCRIVAAGGHGTARQQLHQARVAITCRCSEQRRATAQPPAVAPCVAAASGGADLGAAAGRQRLTNGSITSAKGMAALTGGQAAVQHPAEQALVRLQRLGPRAHIV